MSGSGGSGEEFEPLGPRGLVISRTAAPPGLRLAGDLSSENAHLLTAALDAFSTDGTAPSALTLDLTELVFVDTIGLHVIAHTATELDGRGNLVLASPGPWLRRVLLLSGIDAFPNVELTGPAP